MTEAVPAGSPDATIEHAGTDSDGVREAHVVTTDGERLTAELDADPDISCLEVTAFGVAGGEVTGGEVAGGGVAGVGVTGTGSRGRAGRR